MPRAIAIVLDSVGCGGAPDADRFGDAGADTLGHIAQACAAGAADRAGLRAGRLRLPNLVRLGLGRACAAATGRIPPGLDDPANATARHGCAFETSTGKDTPSGHWELMGAPVDFAWGYFPDASPAFPPELVAELIARAKLPGVLGACHANGVAIVAALGAESVRSGKPICYTSADSVFQIAAHAQAFGLERLYAVCRIARDVCDRWRVGRVIARPFIGDAATGFSRTGDRKDFSAPPHRPTLLDALAAAERTVVSVGKIGDIFGHRATGCEIKRQGDDAHLTAALEAFHSLPDGGFVFANLVDFDTEYGHRRDVAGYAAALEAFDARVPEIEAALKPGDLALITADHGNDPTWPGSDHTREAVPILAFGPGVSGGDIGARARFADVAASLARHLALPWAGPGEAFID